MFKCYTLFRRLVGIMSSPTKWSVNLTQLHKYKRDVKQKPGIKRLRIGDCEIMPAPDEDRYSVILYIIQLT